MGFATLWTVFAAGRADAELLRLGCERSWTKTQTFLGFLSLVFPVDLSPREKLNSSIKAEILKVKV